MIPLLRFLGDMIYPLPPLWWWEWDKEGKKTIHDRTCSLAFCFFILFYFF